MPPKVNSRVRKQDEFQTVQEAKRTPKCRAQMSLPSSDAGKLVIFKCNAQHDPEATYHVEVGRVKLRNGKLFHYDIQWTEETKPEVWREEQEPKPSLENTAPESVFYRDDQITLTEEKTELTPAQSIRNSLARQKQVRALVQEYKETHVTEPLLVAASGTSTTTEDSTNDDSDTNER